MRATFCLTDHGWRNDTKNTANDGYWVNKLVAYYEIKEVLTKSFAGQWDVYADYLSVSNHVFELLWVNGNIIECHSKCT